MKRSASNGRDLLLTSELDLDEHIYEFEDEGAGFIDENENDFDDENEHTSEDPDVSDPISNTNDWVKPER